MSSIFYLSRVSLSTKRAHAHNIAKTCESLKATLVTTSRALNEEETRRFFEEHQIRRVFSVVSLSSFSNYFRESRLRPLNWLAVILGNLSLIRFLFGRRKKIDIIYFRDQHIFLAIIFARFFLKKPVFFEAHAGKRAWHTQILLNLMARISNGIIAISWQLKEYYEKFNKNIIVAFCWAPEKENFPYHKDKKELRGELNLPQDKIIIGYTGRLDFLGVHSHYEVDKVVEALEFLPPNVLFLIIGAAVDKEAKKLGMDSRLKVLPRLPRLEIPAYLLAFDILVIPKLGDLPGDSPAKMLEYLAAGRPIVAAATEPVKEILHHEKNALLVFPNTAKEWSKAIKRLIDDEALKNRIAQAALRDSEKYSWEERAEKILDFLRGTL